MDKLTRFLELFAKRPDDPELNYSIASIYEASGQTAAAISFFLRAAERTDDKLLAYECMLKIGLCFDRQGSRNNSTRGAFKHAVVLLPERPEAYFLLARHYERTNDHVLGYMFAEQGLAFSKEEKPLRGNVEYPGRHALVFQKAVSAWWWGKPDESRRLFKDLWENYKLDPIHKTAVENNLKQLGVQYQPKEYVIDNETKKNKMDIVLQGPYSQETDSIISEYLKLPFVNNIILSCWDKDPPFGMFSSRVRMIRNKPPQSPGTDNKNMQIVSSRGGLAYVETLLAAKMRTDQFYDAQSMTRMWEYMNDKKKGQEIFVAGMYPNLLFHPRDHIFWGYTRDLQKLFDCPLEVNGLADRVKIKKEILWKYYHMFIRNETYLGAHFIANYDPHVIDFLIQPELYLYDNAPKWEEAKKVSDLWTPQVFKPFPREGIDLRWSRKGWGHYPYEDQYATGERWA